MIENVHFVRGLDPVADFFSGTVRSDVVDVSKYHTVTFVVMKGVGATGTSTITVEASAGASPDTVTAIPFRYRAITATDVLGAMTTATASGFATTAGSGQMYLIEVNAQALAGLGRNWVCLKAVEVVDSPVVGCILAILSKPRYGAETVAI